MIAVGFVLAAGAGAGTRHLVNRLGAGWIGTALVNVIGAFALGWLTATDPTTGTATVVGLGFLGSLTTFSTFALEVVQQPFRRRVVMVGAMLALGVGAAALGTTLA